MKGFYSRFASGTLKAAIEAAAQHDDERASLMGEVDAARALCKESIEVCSIVLDPKPEDKAKISAELRMSAISCAQDSLEHVSKLVERMAKVFAISEATFNAQQIENICVAVVNIITTHVDDEATRDAIVGDIDKLKVVQKTTRPDISININ